MPIDRTVFNAFLDDSGSGTDGTIWDKAAIEDALLDPIDVQLALVGVPALGTWTPVIGGNGGTSGQAYGLQDGRYIKIGQLVIVLGTAVLTTKGTISGDLQIKGLPFDTAANPIHHVATLVSVGPMATNWVSIGGYALPNSREIYVVGRQAASAGIVTMTTTDVGNTTGFGIAMAYIEV